MKVIVGLGNPGKKYDNTRHNIGFEALDYIADKEGISYGWSAVLFAIISIVVYITALMCSHISAFRVAANIRKELMQHITILPLGVTEKYGSGKLRRIVNNSSAATEIPFPICLPPLRPPRSKAAHPSHPQSLRLSLISFCSPFNSQAVSCRNGHSQALSPRVL